MARANDEVEALLQEYADLIAIRGGEAFKARAYEKAARAVGGHPQDVSALDAKGLREIPGVGRSVADKIVEYLRTGRMPVVDEARASVPAGVRELVAIPGLGPRKAMLLYEELGLKLSEYGLFDSGSGENVTSETEEAVYARLGLPWIPPTLREDRGEIAAGLRGELPDLIAEKDIRGDLHTHTDLTDGLAPLEDMVAAAAARGYAYYAVTDHAPNLSMQRMTSEKILAQRERVRALDGTHHRMRLLHGTELNIGPDGTLDWPDAFLAEFDLCVASVHSHFNQSRGELTRRLVRACENPHVAVIGHPTTRRIGKRPGIDADFDAVFRACARTGTVLEINAHPERLDLCDEDILRAKRYGVKFAVNSDAHATTHLPYMRYGVATAQRGWLTEEDVVNTWPLTRLRSFLARKDA
ncbi:PHP domain-containing protein [Streptomyces sp. IBSNAI002]|uniref:PHP domain-containing protein n=1 Tax=Streptomyces sp. IBSNAI002 TaxID=3457500 RepID=UPI003FD66810